jgi:hypothetical protein
VSVTSQGARHFEAAFGAVQSLARTTPVGDLPALLGALEAVKAEVWCRLASPPPSPAISRPPDENVSVEEAGRRLGISDRWIYKHADRLPFVRKIGRRVLCSARALAEWNDRQRG